MYQRHLIAALLVSISLHTASAAKQDADPLNAFVDAGRAFPTPEKNLRKWDAPVVADLDQDGWADLVFNDHGYSIHILWNNKGRFSKPWDLVMGDLHGVTVGDYDQDGLLEMVISRGGGSGKNARNSMMYKVGKDRSFTRLPDFPDPLAMMRGRTVKFLDGDHDGDLDLLNFAFPGKEKNGASENYIYMNDGEGLLLEHTSLPPSFRDGQKILITDFNSDTHTDLIMYGHTHLRAFQGDGKLGYTEVTDTLFPQKINSVTSVIEADIDNDGDFDLYLSRGEEMKTGDTFYSSENETWGFFAVRSKFEFEDLVIGDVLELVNYQSPWPNKKLYRAETGYEYEFSGETHSGADVRLVSSDNLGWPDTLPEKGLYLGFVGNESWRVAGTAGSPMTAVVRNVRGEPTSVGTEGPSDILLENQNGRFVDISEQAGIGIKEHTTSVATADFDNNGFSDFVVLKRGNLVTENESILYLNQGDRDFERATEHGILSPELGAIGLGVEVLDYNQDGKVDVVLCNERGKWRLFKNSALADGNYIVIDLGKELPGHASTLGAMISIQANGSTQSKRSGTTGAMYSRSMDRFIHFGIGEAESVDQIQVRLTNGEVFELNSETINTIISLDR
ncbi:MAG: CRTAC1 family protein [Opitutaceae bacterium]